MVECTCCSIVACITVHLFWAISLHSATLLKQTKSALWMSTLDWNKNKSDVWLSSLEWNEDLENRVLALNYYSHIVGSLILLPALGEWYFWLFLTLSKPHLMYFPFLKDQLFPDLLQLRIFAHHLQFDVRHLAVFMRRLTLPPLRLGGGAAIVF